MVERSAVHGTFTIERRYDAAPARAFAAWATIEAKARWFIGPPGAWTLLRRELEFRVGGEEILSGVLKSGVVTTFIGHYRDIVSCERLIYSYDVFHDQRLLSVSLATVEFKPAAAGTRLVFTEQAAFLDGFQDGGGRENGTGAHLDRLGTYLDEEASAG